MGTEVTDDEATKAVVDGAGNHIGIVREVEDGTAHVDPDPDLNNELKTKLGWGSETRTTYPLRNDAIDEITDDEIRLQPDYHSES